MLQFLVGTACPVCHGKRLRPESLSVKFAGLDIAEISALPLTRLIDTASLPSAAGRRREKTQNHPERDDSGAADYRGSCPAHRVMLDLGLGYLSLERSTPTLSPGELQRLRLATQVCSNLFGVVYVLDEPSAGLHPADTESLLVALDRLKASGNSLFIVEHELDVIRHADWVVDVGPGAGQHGGEILYSGPPEGLEAIRRIETRARIYSVNEMRIQRTTRSAERWLRLEGVTRNNLRNLSVAFPLRTLTSVTGVSGSGKSSLVSQALVELVGERLGRQRSSEPEEAAELLADEGPSRFGRPDHGGRERDQAAGPG